jgi:esterase
MASPTPSSHLLPIDGLTHHYLRWGEPDRPAVLLLHGLRSYAATWEPLAAALSEEYLVIAPDLRGRGRSSWDPERNYFTRTYVQDVATLAESLGLARFSIVGHSLGGAVGYAYAAAHPGQVGALVVEDIGPGSSTETAGAGRIRREIGRTPGSFDSLDAVRAYWRGIRPGITEEALASRIDNTVRRELDGAWVWTLDMAGIGAARLADDPAGPVDLWAAVDGLRCPTLVLRGDRSDFLTAAVCAEMARRQPLLTWAEVPGAGHYVHDDNPGAFHRLVTGFLRRGVP